MQRGIATDLRWTWIFGTILILVVVVVIGFLSGITSALNSIDKALGTTDATLTDVGGDADPLPGYISKINDNLTAIDKALKPVPGQGVSILNSLTSINGSTGRVNAALKNTSSSLLSTSSSLVDTTGTLQTISGSLVNTSDSLVGTTGVLRTILSSLRDTSGVLVTVNGRVRTINQVLRQAAVRRQPGHRSGSGPRVEHRRRWRPHGHPLRHEQDQQRPDRRSQPPDEHLQVGGCDPAGDRDEVLIRHVA